MHEQEVFVDDSKHNERTVLPVLNLILISRSKSNDLSLVHACSVMDFF